MASEYKDPQAPNRVERVVPESFTFAELEELRAATAASRPRPCPRCGSPVEARHLAPRRDVPYVRDRLWLTCMGCGSTGVIDQPRKNPNTES